MHRDTSNTCSIKRNVPRECLYAREVYARQLYYSLDTYIPFTLRSYIRGNNLLQIEIAAFSKEILLETFDPSRLKKEGKKIFCLQNSIKKLGSILFLIIDLGSVA